MKRAPWLKRAGLVVLASLLLAALGFVALRSGPLAPIRVTVVAAQEARLPRSIFGVGTVEAQVVYNQISGVQVVYNTIDNVNPFGGLVPLSRFCSAVASATSATSGSIAAGPSAAAR